MIPMKFVQYPINRGLINKGQAVIYGRTVWPLSDVHHTCRFAFEDGIVNNNN
ncbi:hypothetical protein LOAG_15047 [Loa loa]|uniref:Uncharacterized protein n=1 Tax=Loa loa TaxID=7209 RepID=A0A1S0THV6_LOALO|nr:hypothetical protein LOAG_15047 [Loa loa]EFO13482.1 hypothetical protein LOAG_15047 [Loa loa]